MVFGFDVLDADPAPNEALGGYPVELSDAQLKRVKAAYEELAAVNKRLEQLWREAKAQDEAKAVTKAKAK